MKNNRQHGKLILAALALLTMSAIPIAASCLYQSHPPALELVETPIQTYSIIERRIPRASEANAEELREIPKEEEETEVPWQPSLNTLNLAHYYPEEADPSDPLASYAGMAYRELTAKEAHWISQLDEIAAQNPSVRSVHIALSDGDSNPITTVTSVAEVMSMANVYTWYKDPGNYELFLDYAVQLWKESHAYTFQYSDLYYCSGCQESSVPIAEEASDATPSDATPSDATPSDMSLEPLSDATLSDSDLPDTDLLDTDLLDTGQTAGNCPGHMDLIVRVKITGLNGQHNLFALDAIGNDPANIKADGWPGWNEETMQAARDLYAQNWYENYGLSVNLISTAPSLSAGEIESYMQALPEELSPTRKELIRFALESVGRVPYYWGGKASHPGYDGNRFGSLISPDPEGRILKGLDCSGWVNWVYWSVTGNRLPFESTAGLSAVGTPIAKEDLEPGDLVFRTGDNSHAILFLGWTSDGKIRCIHESSDVVNNVTIAEKNADWPYYRRIIE